METEPGSEPVGKVAVSSASDSAITRPILSVTASLVDGVMRSRARPLSRVSRVMSAPTTPPPSKSRRAKVSPTSPVVKKM